MVRETKKQDRNPEDPIFETKDSRNLCWSPGSKENNFVYCQEWRCAKPQFDTSDLE